MTCFVGSHVDAFALAPLRSQGTSALFSRMKSDGEHGNSVLVGSDRRTMLAKTLAAGLALTPLVAEAKVSCSDLFCRKGVE